MAEQMQWTMPEGALSIIRRLNAAGHRAYAVGGCVRDSLLGIRPKDYDVCTSARPEEMQAVFRGERVVETGLKHGTLTVVLRGVPYEVTTFRADGTYTDHRHPDGVTFVDDLREDLARRDFTVNAMAWHPEEGLVDAFGGREDLGRGVIRCVGEPERRFEEDALRILRALRFASSYGFRVEERTAAAVHRLYPSLRLVAAERIRVEAAGLLCGRDAGRILREFTDVVVFLMPELAPCVGFDQHSRWHAFDVWEHTVRAVEAVRPTETLRLAMLLHDSGKPERFTLDEAGEGHFYGHAAVSAEKARAILERLRADKATQERVTELVGAHDVDLRPEKHLLTRRLNRFGEEALRQLIEVRRADALATGTAEPGEVSRSAEELTKALDALLSEKPCFTLRDLAVDGRDMMALGYAGPQVGERLRGLLERVMDGSLPNERESLLRAAKNPLQNGQNDV